MLAKFSCALVCAMVALAAASAEAPAGAAKGSGAFDDFDVHLSVAPRDNAPDKFEVKFEFEVEFV